MDFKDFTASNDDDNRRLDKIIRVFIPDLPLSEIYKLIRKGLIRINQKKCKAESRVAAGDIISIASFIADSKGASTDETKATGHEKKSDKLPSLPPVVFENQHILILNKPYNMSVHGEENSLDKIVLEYYRKNAAASSLSFKPGPLHRIDKKTTGLVVFSKSLEGARWFTEKIKNHEITKLYYGLFQGKVKDGDWRDVITNDRENSAGFFTVNAGNEIIDENSRYALSHVKALAYGSYNGDPVSLAKIHIETGRKHQIRAQSSLHKTPLLGDLAYGGKKIVGSRQDFFLQASELHIPENELGIPSLIELPLSDYFKEMLKHCDINKSDV